MKPKKRQKLCQNCEGDVDVDVIVCPFCAADLREADLAPRYPSYVSTTPTSSRDQEEVAKVPTEEKTTHILLPILLMTLGAQLLMFGLCMLLFSHQGVLMLKWDARYWFFYIATSIPLLIFGYKRLVQL
jgi:hypothetical protein